MSSGMPELGSKISLISKADIRYEGRLFTVDPQECTIALASVRSFGTEDRETQYPVAPQNQVYDYILFRGSDIKDIRVVNNASSLPNDPAIVQLSAPGAGGQFQAQFHGAGAGGPPHGLYAPYRPPAPALAAPGRPPRASSSVLDLIGANAAPSSGSRSATPGARKSPAQAERSTQADERPPRRPRNDERPRHDERPRNDRPRDERPRDDRPRNQRPHDQRPHDQRPHDQRPHDDHYQRQRQRPDNRNYLNHNNYGQNNHPHNQNQNHHYSQQQMHQQPYQYYRGGRGGGGWRGRGAGGRPGQPLPPLAAGAVASDGAQRPKNTLKFEDDYDFEQANTRFEELRTQLAKVKLEEAGAPAAGDEPQPEAPRKIQAAEAEKKDDSGNETGAGEAEAEEGEGGEGEGDGGEGEGEEGAYDKAKSFFDNISCEAVERSMGRSQRRDWRAERKLNSETFGVASARRAPWRGARGGWRGGWGQRGPQHYQPQHRRGQQRHHIHHSQQHQGQHQPQPQAQQGN